MIKSNLEAFLKIVGGIKKRNSDNVNESQDFLKQLKSYKNTQISIVDDSFNKAIERLKAKQKEIKEEYEK